MPWRMRWRACAANTGRRASSTSCRTSAIRPARRCRSTRRQAIAALAQEAGLTILEDDVYRHLWFDAPPPPPLSDLAPDHVIRLGSFSKLLAPGLRVGWLHRAA